MNAPTLTPEAEQPTIPANTPEVGAEITTSFDELNPEDLADRASHIAHQATLEFQRIVDSCGRQNIGYKCLTFRRADPRWGIASHEQCVNENQTVFKRYIIGEIQKNLQLSQSSDLETLLMVRVTYDNRSMTLNEAIDSVLDKIRSRGEDTFRGEHERRDSKNYGWQMESKQTLRAVEILIGEAANKLLDRNSLEQENAELKKQLEKQAAGLSDLQTEVRALTERLLIISEQLAQSPIEKLTADVVSKVNGVKDRVKGLNPLKFLQKQLEGVIAPE